MTVINVGGRPRAFETVEEMGLAIQHYFDSITRTLIRTEMYDTGETKPVFDKKLGKEFEEPIYKERPVLNNAGEPVKYTDWIEKPTVTGLCLSLNITRTTLFDYEKNPMFSNTITRAKQIIENYIETDLLYEKTSSRGAQFNLNCNYNWNPKQEIDANVKVSKLEDFF